MASTPVLAGTMGQKIWAMQCMCSGVYLSILQQQVERSQGSREWHMACNAIFAGANPTLLLFCCQLMHRAMQMRISAFHLKPQYSL